MHCNLYEINVKQLAVGSILLSGPICQLAIFRSNQWSKAGSSKAVVCAILHVKGPLLLEQCFQNKAAGGAFTGLFANLRHLLSS